MIAAIFKIYTVSSVINIPVSSDAATITATYMKMCSVTVFSTTTTDVTAYYKVRDRSGYV